MKRIPYIITALALVCIITCSVRNAFSYFSTYTKAEGGMTVNLIEETSITEKFDDKGKYLTIHNDDKNVSVYVRAKAFVGEAYKDSLEYDGYGKWVEYKLKGEDEYYYYGSVDGDKKLKCTVLKPGEETTKLRVSFKYPVEPEIGDENNVTVIYESAPVLYNEDGTLNENWDEVWNQKLIVKTEGGN